MFIIPIYLFSEIFPGVSRGAHLFFLHQGPFTSLAATAARIVCVAGPLQLSGVRRLSVPERATAANIASVAGQAGDIDRLLHGAQQRGVRMLVVPPCQRTVRSVTDLLKWLCSCRCSD